MNNKTEDISNLAKEVMNARNLEGIDWESLTVVADLGEGHFSQSGFLYLENGEIEPFTVKCAERRAFSNSCKTLASTIFNECNSKPVQLLIQLKSGGRIKIDFEFDNANRWTIVPSRLKEMREELRPRFE